MKKTYQSPEFYTVQLETQQMLALSKGSEYTGGPKLAPRYGCNDRNGNDDPNFDEEDEDEEDW